MKKEDYHLHTAMGAHSSYCWCTEGGVKPPETLPSGDGLEVDKGSAVRPELREPTAKELCKKLYRAGLVAGGAADPIDFITQSEAVKKIQSLLQESYKQGAREELVRFRDRHMNDSGIVWDEEDAGDYVNERLAELEEGK